MLKEGSVKPGDEVVVYTGTYSKVLATVARITPSGRIVLTNGSQYNKTGWEISSLNFKSYLEPATPEIRAELLKRDQVSYLKSFEWHRLDNETLNDLAQWMHSHGFDTMPIRCAN